MTTFWPWIALVLIGAGLLAIVVVLVRTRTDSRGEPDAHSAIETRTSEVNAASMRVPVKKLSGIGRTKAGLVPLGDPDHPELALILGDPGVVGRMMSGESGIGRTWSTSQPAVAVASTGNIAAQALHGYQQASGLVRLAPETVAAIRSGSQVIKSGGWNLGVLRASDSGQFVSQVRWAPVGGALGAVASVASAATMAMIQFQLSAISRQLGEVTEGIKRLEKEDRIAQLSRIEALAAAVDEHRKQAEAAGQVSDKIMSEIRGAGQELDEQIRIRLESCQRKVKELSDCSGVKARRAWLEKKGAASVEDIGALLLAAQAWSEQRAMYAANLAAPVPNDLEATLGNQEAAREAVSASRRRLAEVGVGVSQLVYELDRALHIATEVLGQARLRDRAKEKLSYTMSGQLEAKEFAEELRSLLGSAGIPIPPVPPFPSDVEVVGEDMDSGYRTAVDQLMYLLRPQEVLLGIYLGRGAGRGHNLSARRSILMLTNERVIGVSNKTLSKTGDVFFDVRLDQIEDVAATRSYRFTAVRIALREGIKLPTKTGGKAYEINLNSESADSAARAISDAITGKSDGRARAPIGPVWDTNYVQRQQGVGEMLALEGR